MTIKDLLALEPATPVDDLLSVPLGYIEAVRTWWPCPFQLAALANADASRAWLQPRGARKGARRCEKRSPNSTRTRRPTRCVFDGTPR